MKILFVTHEDKINGASHSLINLLDVLSNKCECSVITPYKYGPFMEELKKKKCKNILCSIS